MHRLLRGFLLRAGADRLWPLRRAAGRAERRAVPAHVSRQQKGRPLEVGRTSRSADFLDGGGQPVVVLR
jgi:hypothetical protein